MQIITYIPDNKYGIESRDYTLQEIVALLRANKNNPDIVQFIADMIEE